MGEPVNDTELAEWTAANLAYLTEMCGPGPWRDATSERTETMASYTEHRYTKPQEHTLYPQPQYRYECSECGAAGYHYPDKSEVWTYHECIQHDRVTPGSQHVWVYEDTMQTQGTGDRVFAEAARERQS